MHNEDKSNPTLTNCTFSNNSASYGGGMYNYGYNRTCSPTLTNCTFSGNSASSQGGGMCNGYSSPTLTNCILWGNTASSSGNEIYNSNSNSNPTIDTCIIEGGYSSYGAYTNIITSDPKLMPLGNYGGSVQTCPVGAGSSAIGSGKFVSSLTTDARGFTRSSTPTIGACEYQNKLTISPITTSEGYNKYSSSYEFTLNVYVSDIGGTFTYQWYKDGEAIEGATSSSYKTSQSVGTSVYTVQVSDGAPSITSSEIIIETVDVPRYYVAITGSAENDGLSWATAKSDVQEAIDLASEWYGCEVWIAKGTYKHGSAMTMKNNVAIYGGFAGTETSKDQRVAGNITILDGEGKYRVFYNKYSSSNKLTNSAKLDNVTIQNGYYSGSSPDSEGGGMFNNYASPEITNCTFSGNSASSDGGGMCNNGYIGTCSPELTNCTFTGNSADDGGGMYNYKSSPELINCTFSNNSASSYGGGMCNGYSSPTLTNCILWGNTALEDGNEIYNRDSSSNPTIDTCIIQNGKDGISGSDYCTFTTEPITADSKLMPLGNYGGSVQTCPVEAGSSAIGAGKVVDDVTTDARGMSRSSTKPTIGACEFGNVDITASEENLEDNILFIEESVSFKVVANETGVNYQWQYSADNSEWVDIDGATSSEFAIDSITSENFGYYRCAMSGEIYNTKYSSVAKVESKPEPSIVTQPTDFEVWPDSNGNLSVSATGDRLTYQWYFNGEAIEGATSATLSFENIQTKSCGEYYCVITNPVGSVQTNTVVVSVKPAPSITTQPEKLGIFMNTNGSLSVSATGEELTYQWYFNGEAIEGATEACLSFENIQTDKAGSYYCVITNPTGSVQSSSADVVVHQTARITKDLANIITIKEIGYARFEIGTDSYNPTFKWYVDGQLLEDETKNVLFIKAGTKTSVTVKCVVSTDDGKSDESKTVRLNALDATHSQVPLSITTHPADSSPTAWGETSKFTISAKSSSSVLNYQWQGSSDGETWENLEGQTGATCSVKMEGYNKNCFVRCEINNGIGAYLYSNSAKVIHSITPTEQPSGEVWLFDGEFYEFKLELGDEFSSGINYDDGVTFQWQISNDSGSTWTNITSDDLHGDGFSGDPLNEDELEIVMTADLDG